MTLRTQLIRLAHAKPSLRARLLPLITKHANQGQFKMPAGDATVKLQQKLDSICDAWFKNPENATGRAPLMAGTLSYYIQFLSSARAHSNPIIFHTIIMEARKAKALSPVLAPVADAVEKEALRRIEAPSGRGKMARGTYVALRDLPMVLQKALKSVGYHRKDVEVEKGTQYSPQEGSSLSEGNRGFLIVVNMGTGRYEVSQGSWGGANMFETKQVDNDRKKYPIPPNGAVIFGSTGGHGAAAQIRVRPDNFANLLPTSDVSLSDKEKAALSVIRGAKSGYRQDQFRRYGLGDYNEQNPLILSLLRQKLIKVTRTGAISITTEGKNVIGDFRI